MSKTQLIQAICKLQGKDANPTHLKTRTIEQLRETYQRWQAISRTTQKEINLNCQFDGLPRIGRK